MVYRRSTSHVEVFREAEMSAMSVSHSVRLKFLHALSSLSPGSGGTRVQVLIASCEGGEIDLVIGTHEAYL